MVGVPSAPPHLPDLVQQIIGGEVRTGVIAFGTWAAAGGVHLTGTELDQIAGTVLVLIMAIWSGVQKYLTQVAARKREVAAAKASAEQGKPVTVTVTPAGQPNIAIPVPPPELIAAPTAPKPA
jgi:hypothetical protein